MSENNFNKHNLWCLSTHSRCLMQLYFLLQLLLIATVAITSILISFLNQFCTGLDQLLQASVFCFRHMNQNHQITLKYRGV